MGRDQIPRSALRSRCEPGRGLADDEGNTRNSGHGEALTESAANTIVTEARLESDAEAIRERIEAAFSDDRGCAMCR